MFATIVIPTYERPTKLAQTLQSVCNQTVEDYEVIVVDDGSESEQQREVLTRLDERERVHVLRQSNAGPAAARNRGWRNAKGDYVLFTDDDCIVPPEWVDSLTTGFEEGIAAVGGPLVPVEELLDSNPFARAHRFRDLMAYGEPDEPVRGYNKLVVGGTANVAYRRSVLDELDGFDESFPLAAGEDADLQKRVLDANYEMMFVPVPVRHNDDYDWQSFTKRAIRSGKGTHHFHQKYSEPRSPARIIVGLVAAVLYFPLALWRSRALDVSVLYVVERALNRWGELSSALASPG